MADQDDHYLLVYTYVADMADRRAPHREAHLERIRAEREAGHLPSAGAFDPPTGAAIVFKGVERAYVEEFVANDPYVTAGLVTESRIERWKLV
jgi:uncharacterized protein YciI